MAKKQIKPLYSVQQ